MGWRSGQGEGNHRAAFATFVIHQPTALSRDDDAWNVVEIAVRGRRHPMTSKVKVGLAGKCCWQGWGYWLTPKGAKHRVR